MTVVLAIYTSEKFGNDETGDGTEGKPFKTILQAMKAAGKEPFPTIYVDGKEEGVKYDVAAKSQLKKIQKIWVSVFYNSIWTNIFCDNYVQVRDQYKQADKNKQEQEDAERRTKNLEEAKKIVIQEDKSLPTAQRIKISDGWLYFGYALLVIVIYQFKGAKYRGQRVKFYGWVHRIRRQGKNLMFITLRDGTGFLQTVLSNDLCNTYNALVLQTESTVVLYGTLKEVPEGKTVSNI